MSTSQSDPEPASASSFATTTTDAVSGTDEHLLELRQRRASHRNSHGSLGAELVRAAYNTALRGLIANGLAIIAFVLVGLTEASPTLLFTWAGLVLALLVMRGVRMLSRMRIDTFPEPARRLSIEYAIGATATGAMFGCGFVLLAGQVDFARQLLLTLAMCGMSAGAALSMAAARWAYTGYTVTSLGAALVWFAAEAAGSQNLTALATVFIVGAYTAVMVVIHSGARRFVYETISLQIENDRFVAALERYSATLSRDREEYRAASLTDALTGVANRRSFDEALEKFWRQAIANGDRIGCLLIDVDHFKPYNDTLGHAQGDVCLRRLADAMDSVSKRGGDFLARYGGEEFVLLAPDTTSAGTLYLAESIREVVESLAIAHPTSPGGVVTVSVGATSVVPKPGEPARALVEIADNALYSAKEAGRNRVQLARDTGTMTIDSGPHAVATASH